MYICTAGTLSVSLINDTVSTSWYGNTLYLLIFGEIWPTTLYYSTGSLANLKIHKKIQF